MEREGVFHGIAGLLPSQVTDDYWVFADCPAAEGADASSTGKWLVFVPAGRIDWRWEQIRLATEQGRLGISAKAATARVSELTGSPRMKLICVHTRNWHDRDDVKRVLRQVRDPGVSWRLSYKTDEATISGVYGTGSAAYVSQPGSLEFDDRTRPMPVPSANGRRLSRLHRVGKREG